ncbi:MAG: hypothetical protein AAF692_08475 [Pseudomonadota bacterium]
MTRFASIMAAATSIGIVAVLLFGPILWLFFVDQPVGAMGEVYESADFTMTDRLLGAGVALVGAVIRAYGLLGLRTTFLEARDGRPLSVASIHGLRRFARVEVVMVLVGALQTGLFGAIATAANDSVQNELAIRFGSAEAGALFIALLLMFAAQIMAEGQKAVQENAAFV